MNSNKSWIVDRTTRILQFVSRILQLAIVCFKSQVSSLKSQVLCLKLQVTSYKSFGIIEVLISGVLIITVIGATVSIRQRVSSQANFAQKQVVAYMLAEEGMEAVRQIRETNYLLKQRDSNTDNFAYIKVPWNCGLVYTYHFYVNAASQKFIMCDAPDSGNPMLNQPGNLLTTNTGNFTACLADTAASVLPCAAAAGGGGRNVVLELSNSMYPSHLFIDERNTTPTSTVLTDIPTWALSSPATLDNGAGPLDVTAASAMMPNDRCVGTERIFVLHGTAGSGKSILENRWPINLNVSSAYLQQPNRRVAGGGQCNGWVPPRGYDEYHRQVLINPAGPSNESPGNAPASWFDSGTLALDTNSHIARVLVRVSWQEFDRQTGKLEDRGVLLSSYLSDWRPSN